VILELGGKVTLSDDSHGAKDVGMHYDKVMDYLSFMGIDKVCYLVNTEDQVKVEEFKGFENWFNNKFK
jgi:histidinol-phosphatase (PHP family)